MLLLRGCNAMSGREHLVAACCDVLHEGEFRVQQQWGLLVAVSEQPVGAIWDGAAHKHGHQQGEPAQQYESVSGPSRMSVSPQAQTGHTGPRRKERHTLRLDQVSATDVPGRPEPRDGSS